MAVKSRNPEYSTFIGRHFKVKNPKAILCTYFHKSLEHFCIAHHIGLKHLQRIWRVLVIGFEKLSLCRKCDLDFLLEQLIDLSR